LKRKFKLKPKQKKISNLKVKVIVKENSSNKK
jgi:hypothetical protein